MIIAIILLTGKAKRILEIGGPIKFNVNHKKTPYRTEYMICDFTAGKLLFNRVYFEICQLYNFMNAVKRWFCFASLYFSQCNSVPDHSSCSNYNYLKKMSRILFTKITIFKRIVSITYCTCFSHFKNMCFWKITMLRSWYIRFKMSEKKIYCFAQHINIEICAASIMIMQRNYSSKASRRHLVHVYKQAASHLI